MSQSLTTFLNALAPILQTTPTLLRERQRALVRAELLESQPGRGRGAGVVASPETVGTLLISLLANPSLAESPGLAKSFTGAVAMSKCPLTGEKRFGAAVVRLIGDPKLAKRVEQVRVQPGGGTAEIVFGSKGNTVFVAKVTSRSKIRLAISITGDTLHAIAALVAKLEADR